MTGNDVTWPQVMISYREATSFERKSLGSGCRRPKTGVYCTFHFLQACRAQEEAVTWQEMTSRDLRWQEVTWFYRKSPWNGCTMPKTGVYCTFHLLQACSSQEEAVTWQEMTSRDLRWQDVTWFYRKSPWSGRRRLKSGVYCTFHFLQACSSQVVAVTWQEMTSRDLRWQEVTRK